MKANVYTGFITSEVKVYSTKKGDKPRKVSGRNIRYFLPYLIASVMTLNGTSCTLNGENTHAQNTENVLTEQTTSPTLIAYSKTEHLSEDQITDLMNNPRAPQLADKNFNHCPENEENFWEIVRNGLDIINTDIASSKRLSPQQKAEYKITARKMLSQIALHDGHVDTSNFNNLKTFLHFEKVVKHKDKYWNVLGKSSGIIDERSEFFGRYYQDQEVLKEKINANKGIQKFAKALYGCQERMMLNYNDSTEANAISRKVLEDWYLKQDIKDTNLWKFTDIDECNYCNTLAVYRSRGNNVKVVLEIDPTGNLGNDYYSPVGSTIIHELQHLGQQKPASKETPADNKKQDSEIKRNTVYYDDFSKELGPTLYSLALEDGIYKEIHHIDKDEIVDYGKIDLGTHKVSIGETAVWFNKMLQKYPHSSIDKVISEPEVFNHLNNLGNNTNTFIMQNSNSGMN